MAGYVSTLRFGATVRPFQNSFFGVPLAPNATLDPNSAQAVTALAAMSGGANHDMLAVGAWTSEPLIVPADQPLVPVACATTDAQLKAIFALGVPLPPSATYTTDTDATICLWQPDYVGPTGAAGRYYELYGMSGDATTGWACRYGGRMYNVNSDPISHWYSWQFSGTDPAHYATDPDSTYTKVTWGAQGTGIPYAPGVLTVADCARNFIDHALLLVAPNYLRGGHVWPAQRDDGTLTSTPIRAGQRYRFPDGYQAPAGLHPRAQLIVQGLTHFGCVISDKTGQLGLGFRAAPSVGFAGYLNGTPDYAILNGFPWHDLQLLTVGSDATPTPIS